MLLPFVVQHYRSLGVSPARRNGIILSSAMFAVPLVIGAFVTREWALIAGAMLWAEMTAVLSLNKIQQARRMAARGPRPTARPNSTARTGNRSQRRRRR
ncbi:MAG: hypothetical protein HYX51_08490 [Chloroflexi bacterium]|nr:hypothetical protein [Chloroflexota bacterium]